MNQASHSSTPVTPRRPRPGSPGPVAPPDVVCAHVARRGISSGGREVDAWLMQQTGSRLLSRCVCMFTCRVTNPPPPNHVSDVARVAADAAHADVAVAAPQWRTAQARGGRGPGRAPAEVPGEEPSGGDAMQTEEKSLGDVAGEEGGRADSDQHAASGRRVFTQPLSSLSPVW